MVFSHLANEYIIGLVAFNVDFKSIRGGSHDYINAYNYLMRIDFNKSRSQLDKVKEDLTKVSIMTEGNCANDRFR